jgi:hypothetical protein
MRLPVTLALLLLIVLALIFAIPAAFAGGDVIVTSCSRSSYGTTCLTSINGTGSSPQIVHVPQDMKFNTDPNWGRNCRSCVDLSKDSNK